MRSGWLTTFIARCAVMMVLSGCIYGRTQQRLEDNLEKLQHAVGGEPSGEPRVLVYRVDGHGGRWIHEVVLDHGRYAEKRTRSDGRHFAFGYDEQGAWLSVDDGAAIAADGGPWDSLARTRAALYRLTFATPQIDDEVAYMGRDRRRWELAYRPAGGKTINLSIDRRHHLPKEMDWVDQWTRLVNCDRLEWQPSPDGAVLSKGRCGAGSFGGRRATISSDTRALLSMQGMQGVPSWATPKARRTPPHFNKPVWIPIVDSRRLRLPVRINDHKAESLVLDSGAFHTVISEEMAKAANVMPTGEPPLFVDPPFLDRSELWVGVVDTLQVGHAVLHGERVLVAKNPRMLGKEHGLLGQSFFRAYVIDVDSPKHSVRVWDRRSFRPSPDQKRVRIHGATPRIEGEVRDVARGQITLDTGMPEGILVHAPLMGVKNRRQRGTDAHLSANDTSKGSADYYTTIRGLRLGPFAFPRMGAIGRDRDREKLGIGVALPTVKEDDSSLTVDLGAVQVELLQPQYGAGKAQRAADTGSGIAIAGMGVMRYLRLTFDMKSGFVFASTGDAYATLVKIGADIERGAAGATISRVLANGPGDVAGLQEGDVVRAVDGEDVGTTDAALAHVARNHGFYCHLKIERNGAPRHIMVDVARPLVKHQRW